jgi:hypothetical protein
VLGSVLVTGGGLVFVGLAIGEFAALDARNGVGLGKLLGLRAALNPFRRALQAQLPARMRNRSGSRSRARNSSKPGLGEEGARTHPTRRDPDRAAIQHGLNGGRNLRLSFELAGAPGAQEDAVRYGGVLAEVAAQLAAKQVAFFGGEGHCTRVGYHRAGA